MAKPTSLERIGYDEYLRREEASPVKHDFVDGCMVERTVEAMAGGSPNHVRITPALMGMLRNALRGRECRAFDADTSIRVEDAGRNYRPDAGVACPPNFLSDRVGVIDNPVVLFEVLSPATERAERGDKFLDYRLLPSLRDYVLISSVRRMVEVFSRQEDGSWNLRIFIHGSVAHLPSVGIDLDLSELYEDATFES